MASTLQYTPSVVEGWAAQRKTASSRTLKLQCNPSVGSPPIAPLAHHKQDNVPPDTLDGAVEHRGSSLPRDLGSSREARVVQEKSTAAGVGVGMLKRGNFGPGRRIYFLCSTSVVLIQ